MGKGDIMLEGIEILAQTEIMQTAYAIECWSVFSFTLMILGFIVFLISIMCKNDFFMTCGGIQLVLGMIASIVCLLLSDIITEPTGRYEYQVTIGENVSITEFYEKYEVIDQNGKIWTIRDKETE